MRRLSAVRLLLAGLALLAAVPAGAADPARLPGRGAYLARQGDCASCHTGPGAPAYGGGKTLGSPFGPIYSTNISPDPEKGIGRYTQADFARAMKEGVRRDGKRLYPAMPYASFAAMTDDDIAALYAYFMQEVPAVSHDPPKTNLSFPFDQRWALFFWSGLFNTQDTFQADPGHDSVWNRGAYLVRSVGHCGACHTPRGMGYQEKGYAENSPEFLSGGVVDHWFAANLRGDTASGLGRWREQDIVDFLRTGANAHGMAFGSMADVVRDSTQYFEEGDLHAIARYLKSLSPAGERASFRPDAADPPPAGQAPPSPSLAGLGIEKPGAGLYAASCAKCHGADGKGDGAKFPPLRGNPAVLSAEPDSLIRILLDGGKPAATAAVPKPEAMPAFGHAFDDRQIADLINFIRTSWGNGAGRTDARAVGMLRRAPRY
jgi:mono/diheme cytochrome c family protein